MENALTISSNLPTFKNKDLNTATKAIADAIHGYSGAVATFEAQQETTRKQVALILARVEKGRLYKDEGLKSLAEYTEAIGMGKSHTHKLENAGRLLDSDNQKVKDFAKDTDWSKLTILSNVPTEDLERAIDSKEITPKSTQNEVTKWKKAYTAKEAAKKPTVVPDYKVFGSFYCANKAPEIIVVDRIALSNPKDFPEAHGGSPILVTKATDSTGSDVYTATYDDHSAMVYCVERLAKETKKPTKPTKPDFSKLDDAAFADLLKEAARRGIKVE